MPYELIFLAVIGIIFFGVGAFLLFHSFAGLIFGQASYHWPTVDGRITKSAIRSGIFSNDDVSHCVTLRYRYSVNGRQYEGKRIGFSKHGSAANSSGNYQEVQDIFDKYPRGSSVKVHYLPVAPWVSTLEPGFRLYGFVGQLVLGLAWTAGIIYMGYRLFERM